MNSIDFDDDSFYICTEYTPRCYIVQKAIQIDRSQIERMVGDLDKMDASAQKDITHPPPKLPYWFTRECRQRLDNCENLSLPSAPSPVPPPLPMPDLKLQLKQQLEYYFSRENLISDRYLRCQMDADMFVPISIIAQFRKIMMLTSDYNLILQVLRESQQVEVDEKGEKVRPLSRRCTIILREIGEHCKQAVEKMLEGGPPYQHLKYGLNSSWYITYENEQITQEAYLHLQNLDVTFNNKPICARIKAGGPPASDFPPFERSFAVTVEPIAVETSSSYGAVYDLSQLLAAAGYVAKASFRPGVTVMSVEEHRTNRRNRSYTMDNSYVQKTNYERRRDSTRGGRTPRRPNDRNSAHQGGRRNGGANGSSNHCNNQTNNYDYTRRSQQYWQNYPQPKQNSLVNIPFSTEAPNERHGFESLRRHEDDEGSCSRETPRRQRNGVSEGDANEVQAQKYTSSKESSVYSFEEQAFPSLSQPKPEVKQAPKVVEKPTFSSVAAGKRQVKPEPKKSYAEKLKESSSQ